MYHRKITSKNNLIAIILGLALLFGIIQNIPGPLIPIFVEEFEIGFDRMGLILFISLFFGLISAIIFGRLSDKYNKKLIICLGIVIISIGTSGIAFSFTSFFFTLFYSILNFGFGCLEAGITTGIAELGNENRSHVLTNFTKFVCLGAFIGPLFLFLILHFEMLWRIVFVIILIPFILFLFLLSWTNYPKQDTYSGVKVKLKVKDLLNPVIISGSFALFFHNGVLNLFGSWFTTYFTTFGVLVKYSSIIVSFYWLSVLLGSALAQNIIKKIDEKIYIIIFSFLSIMSLMVIAFVKYIIVKAIFSFLLGLLIGGIFPILLSILFSTGPKITGSIFSFLGFFGYGSIMVYQLVTGYFVETFGKISSIYIQLANSGLSFIFILIMVKFNKISSKKIKMDK